MCGIVAVFAKRSDRVGRGTVAAMMDALRHRGPDDSGSYAHGSVGIGFRRLSILDLSPSGHQPMVSPDGDCVIAFNGEIYNYVELREELAQLGYSFKSTGDTEVLLNAYRAWGPGCLDRLNGMWAFVIHDLRRNVLFGARDRFGIKPLYHCLTEDAHLFASEIKSIVASGHYRSATNWAVASSFLLERRLDETGYTFYEGIEQIPAAHAFEISLASGKFSVWRYYRLALEWSEQPNDPAETFANLFEDAIRIHMRSDVPVGVHLSGGLDSTSIICASARVRSERAASGELMAFSYLAKEFDEDRYIRDTVAQTGARLVPLPTSPQSLWSKLDEVLRYQDEPIHSFTALVGYELMGLAAQHGIKVILNGQGADETLAGYSNYFGFYWQGLFGQGRMRDAWREMSRYSSAFGDVPWRLFLRQLKAVTQYRIRTFAPYRQMALARRAFGARRNDWISEDLKHRLPQPPEHAGNDLNGALADSVTRAPLPLYLRVEDRNSMAHSIEVRVPFLDHRLVELAFSLPPDWHMRGPWNKYMLRQAMHDRIPESVRTRVDKMGFPTPYTSWLAGPLHENLRGILLDRPTRERGLFNVSAIERDLKRQAAGAIGLSGRLFDLAQFELWSRQSDSKSTVPKSADPMYLSPVLRTG
jgi:asparagine synthase (glutamine-hydrolysing)